MSRGGARDGAGRKPGAQNRINAEVKAKALAGGITPLEYMLSVMRDDKAETSRRDEMAKAAAPYCHPRLAATELTGPDGGPIDVRLRSARDELARKLAAGEPETPS